MGSSVFDKMQLRGAAPLVVLHSPPEFEAQLETLDVPPRTNLRGKMRFGFALAFVTSVARLEVLAPKLSERVEDDGLLWFAYPKRSSPRYDTDIRRDHGWSCLGALGFEGVRQVAIDDDWSALRFRRVEHIRSMRRDPSRAMTKAGKKRTRER